MNEDDNSRSLIPRPDISPEKATAGPKRVLSDMVRETLALALQAQVYKPVFSLLIGVHRLPQLSNVVAMWTQNWRAESYAVNILAGGKRVDDLVDVARQQSFDVVMLVLDHLEWRTDTNEIANELDAAIDLVRYLATTFGKPIIALAFDTSRDLPQRAYRAGADWFIRLPCSNEDWISPLDDCLPIDYRMIEGRRWSREKRLDAAKERLRAVEHSADISEWARNHIVTKPDPASNGSGYWLENMQMSKYDLDMLAQSMTAVASRGGNPSDWISAALGEVLIHHKDFLTSGHRFNSIHEAIWEALSSSARTALLTVCPESISNRALAAEYFRMNIEYRASGTICEAHHTDISPILPFLSGEQSQVLERHVTISNSL